MNQITLKTDPIYIKQDTTRYQFSLKYIQDLMMNIGFDLETDRSKYGWYLRQILITELPSYWRLETIMDEVSLNPQSLNTKKPKEFDFRAVSKSPGDPNALLQPQPSIAERQSSANGRRNSTFTKSDSVNLNAMGFAGSSLQQTITLTNPAVGSGTTNFDKLPENRNGSFLGGTLAGSTSSRRGSRRQSVQASTVVYYNIISKEVNTQHPMIPLFRRTFNRLINLNRLRGEKLMEGRADTIQSEEEQKMQKIRKWQEQKVKQENDLDMNLIGTKLRLKNLRQADREKIVEGSSRFKDAMLSMYDIKDKDKYVSERGDSLYPIYDLNTKSKRLLTHTAQQASEMRTREESLSSEELQQIFEKNCAYYDSFLSKQLIDKMLKDEEGQFIMEKVNLREIISNAEYYGVDLAKEPYLVWVGHLPNILSLPPGWLKQVDYERNLAKYTFPKQQLELKNHPADLYIYTLIDRLRDYQKQSFNLLRTSKQETLSFKSYDGLMRNYEANLSEATKQHQVFLQQQALIRKQQMQKSKRPLNSKKGLSSQQSSLDVIQVQSTEGNKEVEINGEGLANGGGLGMDLLTGHQSFEDEDKEKEFNFQLGLNEIYVVSDYELFEVARQCELDLEQDLNLLLALENLIIDHHHAFASTSDWQFRVAHDPAQTAVFRGAGPRVFRSWWVNLVTNQSSAKYPYLDRTKQQLMELNAQVQRLQANTKAQVKEGEEISKLFSGVKGDTVRSKVLEQRQKVTELIIQQRLRLFNQVQKRKMAGLGLALGDGLSKGQDVWKRVPPEESQKDSDFGEVGRSVSPSKLAQSKRSSLVLDGDSDNSQEAVDPYEAQSPTRRLKRMPTLTLKDPPHPSQGFQNLSSTLPQELVDFSELAHTYLSSQLTEEQVKELIFYCPFKLFKDYFKKRAGVFKSRNRLDSGESGSQNRIEEHNDEDLVSSFESVDSAELDSDAMSDRLKERKRKRNAYKVEEGEESDLSRLEVDRRGGISIAVLRAAGDADLRRRNGKLVPGSDALLLGVKKPGREEKVERQIMGLFSSVGRRPSNRTKKLAAAEEENIQYAPTLQQQQFLLKPPMRRLQTMSRVKSQQDYSAAVKLVNIDELDEIIRRVHDDHSQGDAADDEYFNSNFRRAEWPPGAIPSNPISSNPSNPQSQLSQNVIAPSLQRGRTLMQRSAASDLNLNSDFRETLLNLRQLGGVKKKFSSKDSQFGIKGPIFSQEKLNSVVSQHPSNAKKSSKLLRVDMPQNDFDELKLQLDEVSMRDSRAVSQHHSSAQLTKIEENTRRENSESGTVNQDGLQPGQTQSQHHLESVDHNSLDSALNRQTQVVLKANYEHSARESEVAVRQSTMLIADQNAAEREVQEELSKQNLKVVAPNSNTLNFKNIKSKKRTRPQYYQNGNKEGIYAVDKPIIYQKEASQARPAQQGIRINLDGLLNPKSQLSVSNPLLNFGNASSAHLTNFQYPFTQRLLSRDMEGGSSATDQQQFRVLKQIQGVNAAKFREEEKARLQLRFKEQREEKARELRLNFIATTRKEPFSYPMDLESNQNQQPNDNANSEEPPTPLLQNEGVLKSQQTRDSQKLGIELIKDQNENENKEVVSDRSKSESSNEEGAVEDKLQLDEYFKIQSQHRMHSQLIVTDSAPIKFYGESGRASEGNEVIEQGNELQNLKYIKSSLDIKQSPIERNQDSSQPLEDFTSRVIISKATPLQKSKFQPSSEFSRGLSLKRPGDIIISKESQVSQFRDQDFKRALSPLTSDVILKRPYLNAGRAQIERKGQRKREEEVQILVSPSSPHRVDVNIDQVLGNANPANITLENYSLEPKSEQLQTIKSEVTLMPRGAIPKVETKDGPGGKVLKVQEFNPSSQPKQQERMVSSKLSRNSPQSQDRNLLIIGSTQKDAASSQEAISRMFRPRPDKEHDFNEVRSHAQSARAGLTSLHSRKSSVQSSTFRLISPKFTKLSKDNQSSRRPHDGQAQPADQKVVAFDSSNQSQQDLGRQISQEQVNKRAIPTIKFTNNRVQLYSAQSGRETLRSTNGYNSQRSNSQLTKTIQNQTTKGLCRKFFENTSSHQEDDRYYDQYPVQSERNLESDLRQGNMNHLEAPRPRTTQNAKSSALPVSTKGLAEYSSWGFNTERINFRPNTEAGQARARLINLKSSQSQRSLGFKARKASNIEISKPLTAAVNSGQRIKISNLLEQIQSKSQRNLASSELYSRQNKNIGGQRIKILVSEEQNQQSQFRSNISTQRQSNFFSYYVNTFGDPRVLEVPQLKFQEPISGIKPLHVFQMGLRLGILSKDFAFKQNKSDQVHAVSERKDFPELLWIAQQALIIRTPPESIPLSFFNHSYDMYQSLSTLNFGLHPGDNYFRELFEIMKAKESTNVMSEQQIIDCSWLYFVEKVRKEKEDGYYFNMASQRRRTGEHNEPASLLRVSIQDVVDDNDTISQSKFKRILTSQNSLKRRASLQPGRQSSQNIIRLIETDSKPSKLAESRNKEKINQGYQTARQQSSQYQSVLQNLKSKYLKTIKNPFQKADTQTDSKEEHIAPRNQILATSEKARVNPTSPSKKKSPRKQLALMKSHSLFPLSSNNFLNQRRLSMEFTMKNRQEQQTNKSEAIVNLLLKKMSSKISLSQMEEGPAKTLASPRNLQATVQYFSETLKDNQHGKTQEQIKFKSLIRAPKQQQITEKSVISGGLNPTPYQKNLILKKQLEIQFQAMKSQTVDQIPKLKIEEMNLAEKKFQSSSVQAKVYSEGVRKTVAMIRNGSAQNPTKGFNKGLTARHSSEGINEFYEGFDDHQQQAINSRMQQRLLMNQDVHEVLTHHCDPLALSSRLNYEDGDHRVLVETEMFNYADQELIRSIQKCNLAHHSSQKSQQLPRSTVLVNKAEDMRTQIRRMSTAQDFRSSQRLSQKYSGDYKNGQDNPSQSQSEVEAGDQIKNIQQNNDGFGFECQTPNYPDEDLDDDQEYQ